MKRLGIFLIVLVLLAAIFAHARLPASMLDKGWQSCLEQGNEPLRTAYCGCLREGMRGWDMKTYVLIAIQMKSSSAGNKIPPLLEELTRECNAASAAQ